MADVDMIRRCDDADPILKQGDGTALFVVQFRKLNPPAGSVETFEEFWARIDAVTAYRLAVSTFRDDGTGHLAENRDDARRYRFEHPGCAFQDVIDHVAAINRVQGDG
jgi:hypothetical protein